MTIKEISKKTFISESDVLIILKEMNLLKYYRGIHSLADEPGRIQKTLKTYYLRKVEKQEALLKQYKPLPLKFD